MALRFMNKMPVVCGGEFVGNVKLVPYSMQVLFYILMHVLTGPIVAPTMAVILGAHGFA